MALDPSDSDTLGSWTPSGPIPPHLRTFGKFPNVNDWLPGDLVLVSEVDPPWTSQQIIRAQEKLGYDPETDARWHHVAGFLGNSTNILCEATKATGVQRVPLSEYVGKHHIKVMRDNALTIEQRYEITHHMLARMGEGYNRFEILRQWVASVGSVLKPHRVPTVESTGACICSQLYFEAYAAATRYLLVPYTVAGVAPCPAALSNSPVLTEVATRWCKIA